MRGKKCESEDTSDDSALSSMYKFIVLCISLLEYLKYNSLIEVK
jgi:hypothetical protein